MITEIKEKYGNIIDKYYIKRKELNESEEKLLFSKDEDVLNYNDIKWEMVNLFEDELYEKYVFCKQVIRPKTDNKFDWKTEYYFINPYCIASYIDACNNYTTRGLCVTQWDDGTEVLEKTPFVTDIMLDFDTDDECIITPISKEEFLEMWNKAEYWNIHFTDGTDKYDISKDPEDIKDSLECINEIEDVIANMKKLQNQLHLE